MSKKSKIILSSIFIFLTLSFIAGAFNNGAMYSMAVLILILLIHQIPLDNVLSYYYHQKMYIGSVWTIDYIPDDEDNQEERKLGFYIHAGLLIIFIVIWLFFILKN